MTFQAANIIGLDNHLTNETLGFSEISRIELAGTRLPQGIVWTDDMTLLTLESNETLAIVEYRGQQVNYTVKTRTDPSCDVILSQNALINTPGISEIYWGISGICTSNTTLIIPGASGVEIDSTYKLDRYEFQYPTWWEAQMAILKTPKGGFLIWSDDPTFRFKTFRYERHDGRWELRFGTQNVAPFDDLRSISSVRWRITAFWGDWRVAAQAYREWMEENLDLPPLTEDIPWVEDISFVTIMNTDKELLQPLSERVNTSATLLYLPNWRYYEYDRFYPNYTASAEFPEFLSEAHRLGFKVMVHVNYFGISPDHPLYEELKEYHMRDPNTGELLWWEWTRCDPPIYIAYINPASIKWRDFFVQALKDVREKYGVDAFHLDCTLAVFNDANGLVDGLTSTQGNLELHRQLHEAMPDVAFSGEGLSELTIRYEQFAQRHVILGISHFEATWDYNLIDHLHPICAFLFSPFNNMYGYLGVCEPDSYPDYWHAWDASYESLGVVPTLWLRRIAQLDGPGPEMKGLLEKARYFTAARPKPIFPEPEPSIKFAYRTADGKNAYYRSHEFGVVLEEVGPDSEVKVITGRIKNANSAKTRGSVPGWLAYNGTDILDLDPTKTYVLLGEERDVHARHISSLSDNVIVRKAANGSTIFGLSLMRNPIPLFDFVMETESAEKAIRLPNGSLTELTWSATFQEGSLSCGGQQKRAIYSIPPSNGLGETMGTFTIEIPQGGAQLVFFIGLTDMVRPGKSDGATFSVFVDEETIFRRHHSRKCWEEINLNMTPYAGKTVNVSFSVGPGPLGDARFDLAAWGEPQLLLYVPDPTTVDIFCPTPSMGLVRENATSIVDVEGYPGLKRISGHIPMTFAILFRNATLVEPPFKLVDAPFEVKVVRAGVEEDPSGYASCTHTTVSCGGLSKDVLFEHPPPSGTTQITFILDLPHDPVALDTSIGIADGSLSEGVVFIIGVNWNELVRVKMLPSYWDEISVDLSEYANETVLLTLETDPDGVDYYDWAAWGEPSIVMVPETCSPIIFLSTFILTLRPWKRKKVH